MPTSNFFLLSDRVRLKDAIERMSKAYGYRVAEQEDGFLVSSNKHSATIYSEINGSYLLINMKSSSAEFLEQSEYRLKAFHDYPTQTDKLRERMKVNIGFRPLTALIIVIVIIVVFLYLMYPLLMNR